MTISENDRSARTRAVFTILATIAALLAGASIARADSSLPSDAALLAALKSAADSKLSPEKAAARAGRPPAIDTRRKYHWAILHRATIVPDDDGHGAALDFTTAKNVMYWLRDIPAHNAPIAGLIWQRDGSVTAFTAFVLPP